MDESQEISRNMEVKMRAKYFEHRRRSVGKCLSVLFRTEEQPGQEQRQGPECGKLSKEPELAIVIQKIKLRRRMSTHWLEICRHRNNSKSTLL